MSGYLLGVIGAVLLCAVLTAILPNGKTAGVIKGITKLVCLIAIISPVLRFFQTGLTGDGADKNLKIFFSESVIQTDDTFINYCSTVRIENAENLLEREMREKFSRETQIKVDWIYEKFQDGTVDGIKITKITVKCQTEIEKEEAKAMWEYLTKNYCSEVLIE